MTVAVERVRAFATRRLGPEAQREVSAAIPAAIGVALILLWVAKDGGYADTTWLPGAVFVVALLLVVYVVAGIAFDNKLLAASALCLTGFTVWNYLSILWSDERGVAWEGANRTLLYLCLFVVLVRTRLTARATAVLVGGCAIGIATIVGASVLHATDGTDPGAYFVLGRLSSPIGYQNGNAALAAAAFWPLALFASRRGVPALIRGLCLAGGGLLLETVLLCQSRMTLVAVPLVAVVYVLLVPKRLRAAIMLVPVAVALTVSWSSLTHVYSTFIADEGELAALSDARHAVARSVVALFFTGTLIALVDRAVRVPERLVRGASVAALALTLAVAGVAAVAAVAKYGNPVTRAEQGWNHFKSGRRDDYRHTHLLSGLGSGRYDMWRVAVIEFGHHPVGGIGSDNFAVPYVRLRHRSEEPLYPHSLELRVLSQTGIVGVLLFAGFLLTALGAWWRTRRLNPAAPERAAATAGFMLFVYWFVHGSVDWLWEIPALGALAIFGLTTAIQTRADAEPTIDSRVRLSSGSLWAVLAGAAVALCAAASLTAPWISAREVQLATREWQENPTRAFDRLRVARRLNPLSDEPDAIAAAVAGRLNDLPGQRRALERALQRESANWYSHFELGVLDGVEGRVEPALGRLAEAARLNPTEPLIAKVANRVRKGEPIDPRAIDREFAERASILQKHSGQSPTR